MSHARWQRFFRITAWCLAMVMMTSALLLWAGGPAIREWSLQSIEARVRKDFPRAPQISTTELAARLQAGEKPLLLDVRRPEEFAVSRLPGAVRVDPADLSPELLDAVPRSTPIVAYCSVGYRSSRLVEALQDEGFQNVVNLEGSIFRWVQEHRELEDDAGDTQVVHPYGRIWGALVPADLRSFGPVQGSDREP